MTERDDPTGSITVAPLPPTLAFLDIVTDWDPDVTMDAWRPQARVPAVFTPGQVSRTVVVANQKGGAGKTTTTVELAAAWVAMGYTVRVWGADPQKASLAGWILPIWPEGVPEERRRTLTHLFLVPGTTLASVTYPTVIKGLSIVPSYADLGTVEKSEVIGGQMLIRQAIETDRAAHPDTAPDIEIIDCGPRLGLLTMAALGAADDVVVPFVASGLDFMGMQELHDTITTARERINPKLRVAGVFLTSWEKDPLQRQLSDIVAADYPDAVIQPIRKGPAIRQAPFVNVPARVHRPRSVAVRDFAQGAQLLIPAREA
ncbi:ParA family protein [Streptomyces sp. NPDC052196]|uniref:ParA family protein n=1 Tax=Streptomyces sp. NPDC052196 TaxID=3156691 RepID=UPI003445EC0D